MWGCFGFLFGLVFYFFLKAVILTWILLLGLWEGKEAAQVPHGVLPGLQTAPFSPSY